MLDWRHLDRTHSREPVWFVMDALLASMFVWITVVSLQSAAYVDEFGAIEGWGWALAISPTLLLVVRRLAPATTLAIATVLYMVASASQGDSNAPLAIPFFAYSVGLTRPMKTSAWMVGLAAVAMSTTVFYGPGDPVALTIPVWIMLFAIGWLIALSIRRSQGRATHLALEAASLRAENTVVAEQAASEERARIARELHDAVGHAVNVMVLQAGAARMTAREQPSIDALREIERVGRTALTDLDHMLGLLHHGSPVGAPREPSRTSDDISRLVTELRSAGTDVHLHNHCGDNLGSKLARPVSSAVYRIVQESLTNAVKHAGGARIDVRIACVGPNVEVTVEDDGRGSTTGVEESGGRGIPGMAERATLLGGNLTARPRDGGGFCVQARIPRSKSSIARPHRNRATTS